MDKNLNIAVLIDGDNIPSAHVKEMMEEIAKYGNPTIKRIYGDWTRPNLTKWKNLLLENAITPIQQYGYTTGKNATDSAMIIDAMDLLYSNSIDAFALMTSDSDFTPLVMRVLESGFPVYGFGEKKTPLPFVNACSTFIFTENLANQKEEKGSRKPSVKKGKVKLRQDTALVKLLRTAVEQTSDDEDWAHMGKVGTYISNNSSFSPVNYGYKKLSDLIRATELFEMEKRSGDSAIYLKATRK